MKKLKQYKSGNMRFLSDKVMYGAYIIKRKMV